MTENGTIIKWGQVQGPVAQQISPIAPNQSGGEGTVPGVCVKWIASV